MARDTRTREPRGRTAGRHPANARKGSGFGASWHNDLSEKDLAREREAAVEALLIHPEMSIRDIRDQFKLRVSESTLAKYRRRLEDGEDPYMRGVRGDRPRRDAAGNWIPGRTSPAAQAAVEAARVARALAAVGAVDVPGAGTPDPMSDRAGLAEEAAGRKFAENATGVRAGAAGPARRAARDAGTQWDETARDGGHGAPSAADGIRPPSVVRQLAAARRKALEGVNLRAADVANLALMELKSDLTGLDPHTGLPRPEGKAKLSAKDKAIIFSLTADRFIATNASLEELSPGTSGVEGSLAEIKENREEYASRRRRLEGQLKDRLKIVKIRPVLHSNGARMAETGEADGDGAVLAIGSKA